GDAPPDGVVPPAVVARDRAQHDADEHAQKGRPDGHLERDLSPVEEPEELVPSELPVTAENEQRLREVPDRARVGNGRDVRPRPDREQRLWVGAAGEEVVRAVAQEPRGDRRADERREEEEDDEEAAADRDPVALEAPPHQPPVATRAYGLELAERRPRLDRDGRSQARP